MRKVNKANCFFAGLFYLVFAGEAQPEFSANAQDITPPAPATLVAPLQNARVQRAGNQSLNPASTNELENRLEVGDRVYTLENGRATIRLGEKSLMHVDQLTVVQILTPRAPTSKSRFALLQGLFYLLHRDRPVGFEVQTAAGNAAIEGTDFAMSVDETGLTRIAVIDGVVQLSNTNGSVRIGSGEQGTVRLGEAPTNTALLSAVSVVQWSLYYPGVLDPTDLDLDSSTNSTLAASLAAYRSGDLVRAFSLYTPDLAQPLSMRQSHYRAGLLLAVGRVADCEALLRPDETNPLADALRLVIAAVKNEELPNAKGGSSSSQLLGYSYYQQSRHDLKGALRSAYQAVSLSTNFGFGWERVAELEFSFGRVSVAERALARALQLAPRNPQAHALRGFLLAADNRIGPAIEEFNAAISIDSHLANAWLGRGLCRIKSGHTSAGREDLQTAAVLEPTRSLFRSYLGKSFINAGDLSQAHQELALARRLDGNDPTPLLYFALLEQQENRINEAIEDLETSKKLGENRSVYRSRLLLDQDRAVRSANLASIYRDAGMTDVSVQEAGSAVTSDYANYSAHLFLANSYNELRDPNLINLRYETATFSEYLIANLLAPVGGSQLSPYVSQQEYSRLFERERLGFSSQTTYLSRGDWQQNVSQYGWVKDTGYALDVYYRSQNGARPNNDLEQVAVSLELKQQLTPQDSVYLQTIVSSSESGDVNQYYDQRSANPSMRMNDDQTPNLFLGYHHEWSPAMHTLLLAGRLEDRFSLRTTNIAIPGFLHDSSGAIVDRTSDVAAKFDKLTFHSSFEAYSAELQQIAQVSQHTLIGGARYQTGETQTRSEATRFAGHFPPIYNSGFSDFVSSQVDSGRLTRLSVYGYDQWQVAEPLWLTVGVSYDLLHYPLNVNLSPISDEEQTTSRVSPKAGFVWMPAADTTFRAAFTRSIGGLFYDSSIRLEPVQIAGFDQAYRSLIPESSAGAIPGSKFQTFDLGFEQKFKSRTYLVMQLELLQSDASQDVGAFAIDSNYLYDATPTQLPQKLKYEERSLILSLNQLVGQDWAIGAHYRVSHANLKTSYPGVSVTSFPDSINSALLHTLDFYAIFNHPSGFFAEADALWRRQSNYHYQPIMPGDDFWQFNLLGGYRFARRKVEFSMGLLNLFSQDYRLNPLNLYQELPRQRTLFVSLKLNF